MTRRAPTDRATIRAWEEGFAGNAATPDQQVADGTEGDG
jgi:hypothetical protein